MKETSGNQQVMYCEECADRYRWPKDRRIVDYAANETYECTVCGVSYEDAEMYYAEWNADKGMVVKKTVEAKKPAKSSIRDRVQQRVAHDGRTHG